MSFDRLRTLAAYVPPGVVRATLAAAAPQLPADAEMETLPAALLFADVSGFTPLTEALAQKGSEGPEELTRLLNGYFSHMIAVIEAEGGEVVKFSGDALTVMFPARDESLAVTLRRAVQAAEAMQAAMSAFSTLTTSVGPVALGMKIGVGAGQILAARVGGLYDRWEYVIAGDPLRQVAEAEHRAARGEIVLSPEAHALLPPEAVPPRPLPPPAWEAVTDPAAAEAVLRGYVPRVVGAWLSESLQAWLAVLRPMTVVFAGLDGIDYADPGAIRTLHGFLRTAQQTIRRYEGSVNKLAVDDKGTILLSLFGAPPEAHEDDPERALRCALELQAAAQAQGLQLAAGVTTGRVFAGPVGSATRREYTVMGDAVNLAARLMSLAGQGQLRCDFETYRSVRGKLTFDLLQPVHVKGKAGMIRLYRPTGEAGRGRPDETGRTLIGRRAELARWDAALDEIHAGRSRVLVVEGEAGLGKSRLVEEGVRLMRERGVVGLLGTGRSIEQQTPYRAWRDIFASYFDLDDVDNLDARLDRVRSRLHDVDPDLEARLPILDDVLNLGAPETPLTTSLDPHLRHESLVSLLLALLRAWVAERPLVIVLEDAHWLDTLSRDLTLQVARALAVARLPLFLTVVTRPAEAEAVRAWVAQLLDLAGAEHLQLQPLSPDETVALAAGRLGVTVAGLPEAVADLIRTRADGNPFIAEELVYYLRENGLITVSTEAGWPQCQIAGSLTQAAQDLPDTVHGLVLSRIDRLPPEKQLVLKVAAVIGRTFALPILRDILGEQLEITERLLRAHLDDLAGLDMTPLEAPEPELTYMFKHIITHEVAYGTLLFAQRRQLHRLAALWYERALERAVEEAGRESSLPLLVYHWRQAEDRERERHYAGLAGRWAAAQFANVEAVGYFSRALELTPDDAVPARYELYLAREAVNDLRGERAAQADDLASLEAIAQHHGDARWAAEVALRRANYAETVSDYPAALEAVRRAVAQAQAAGDAAREAEAHIAWGKVLWRQGDFAAAQQPLTHALALAHAHGDTAAEARSLYYLGDVSLFREDAAEARRCYEQALALYQALGHRQGEADTLGNLGTVHYDLLGDRAAARDYYERALPAYKAIGDRRGESILVSNLGMVYCDLGDYAAARDYHEQALALRRAIGDLWGEAVSRVNLGLVYHGLGDDQAARESCQQALDIQRRIGDRRGQGYSLTYLGHALAGLGEWGAAAEAYDEAYRLRQELGQRSLAIDDLAGLAGVALAQGDAALARRRADEIVAWLDANGPGGIEYPLQVYWMCYRVLSAAVDGETAAAGRARALLDRAHGLLMEQAAQLRDPGLRRKLLEAIATNREIIAAWAGLQGL